MYDNDTIVMFHDSKSNNDNDAVLWITITQNNVS